MSQCGTDSFEEFAVSRESVGIEEIKTVKKLLIYLGGKVTLLSYLSNYICLKQGGLLKVNLHSLFSLFLNQSDVSR